MCCFLSRLEGVVRSSEVIRMSRSSRFILNRLGRSEYRMCRPFTIQSQEYHFVDVQDLETQARACNALAYQFRLANASRLSEFWLLISLSLYTHSLSQFELRLPRQARCTPMIHADIYRLSYSL